MIWVDYVFIGIVLLSMLVGVFRGLVREALSLGVWVLAFFLSLRLGPLASDHMQNAIRTPAVRSIAAYAIVFFIVLIFGSLLTWLLSNLVKGSRLGSIDRTLGAGFGLVRGVFVLAAIVLLAGASPARQETWWTQSVLLPRLEPLARVLQGFIPEPWLAFLEPRAVPAEPPKNRPEH